MSKRGKQFGLLAAAVVLVVWLMVGRDRQGGVERVVLISIDTCRADYLGCYGQAGGITPNIDALAGDGVLFENAYSPVPITLPSHSSMLTGVYPTYHGVHDNDGYQLGEDHETLAEIFKKHGYTTGAVVSSYILDSQFGLAQGFDSYNDDKFGETVGEPSIDERIGGETSHFALEWLDEHRDEKFFLFLHYYDPHGTYTPPEPYASRYWHNKYAGEVAYVDECIGKVIDKLKGLGIYDSSLIVITSDHGEMLGEHGETTHAYYIYESAIRVPLVFKLSGKKASRRVKDPVSLVDIVPTVCSLAGFDGPEVVHGKDLSGLIAGKSDGAKGRSLYIESFYATKYGANSLLGVVADGWKYIQTTRPELYDLVGDRGEEKDLSGQEAQRGRVLQDRLRQILEETVRQGGGTSGGELNFESRKRLESLGYVGGFVKESFEFDQSLEDPKDVIDFHAAYSKVHPLIAAERYAEAMKICRELVGERPRFPKAYFYMGKIYLAWEKPGNAIGYFENALSIDDQMLEAHNELGRALALEGRSDEAISRYEKSLGLYADQVETLGAVGRLYYRKGDLAKAYERWMKCSALDGANVEVLNNLAWLGSVYVDADFYDPAQAVRRAEMACELTEYKRADLMDTLSVAYGSAGRFEDAVETAELGSALVAAGGQTAVAKELEKHAELFRKRVPYVVESTEK